MKNRFFAILLAMALLMAALPVSGLAASSKSGKVKGNSASIAITGDGIVMNIKWDKVVVSFDQNTTSKGWVSRKGTDAVWY